MAVTVDIIGLEGLLDNIKRVRSQLKSTAGWNRRIAEVMKDQVRGRFDSKTAPSGASWQSWAPSTAKERAATPGASLLALTGKMRKSLYSKVTTDSAEIGFRAAYAAFHESGTSKMPARPLLADGDQLARGDEAAIMSALEERLNQLAQML